MKDSPFNTKFNEVTKHVQAIAAKQQEVKEGQPQNAREAKEEDSKTVEPQNRKVAKGEIYTDKTSVYFSPPQTEKLALLAIEYKKKTGKKIAANEIVRKLVDRCNLEDILV